MRTRFLPLFAVGLGYFIFSIPASAQASLPFEARVAREADGKVMVRWDSARGLVDTLQMSGDLVTWQNTNVSFYGSGGPCSVHVYTVQLPDQPPPSQPTGLPRTICRFFWITTFQDATGKAVIGTRDEAGDVWQVQVTANLKADEDDFLGSFSLGPAGLNKIVDGVVHPVVLMGNLTDWRGPDPYQPVVALSTVPAETQQWINTIISRAGEIRAQRNANAAAFASAPLTENPPGPKRFFRIVRNRVDSDSDTLWDDEEWAQGTNAFLTDSNYDGISDAQEAGKGNLVDSDGDGLMDDEDAVPWNKSLHFKRVPESRYAVMPLGPGTATFINDLNEVVIENAARPTTGSFAAPQGVRIWNAETGISRALTLDSSVWMTESSFQVRDFDNQGRLLLGGVSPNPPFTTAGYKPFHALVVEDAGSATATVKDLPFPSFPASYDRGGDGLYSGGPSADALLTDGRVAFGRFELTDDSPYAAIVMKGNYWTRTTGGSYSSAVGLADILSGGFPVGYGWQANLTAGQTVEDLPPYYSSAAGQLAWGGPGVIGYKNLFNRGGWAVTLLTNPTPEGNWVYEHEYWRVDRPLPGSPTGYVAQEFHPFLPSANRLLSPGFCAVNDMKATECGSGPLIFENGSTTSGFIWEGNPATAAGAWQRFEFTNPDGKAPASNRAYGNSLMNDRGEILDAFKFLWRNGKHIALTSLFSHPNASSFSPTGINTHGLISGNLNPTYAQPSEAAVLLPVQVTYARGDKAGKPLSRIPLWSTSDGVGRGASVGGGPNRSVSISWSNDDLNEVHITAFGESITLQRATLGGIIWISSDQTSILTLAAAPLRDNSVQEVLDATLTFPAAGLSASRYPLKETAAGSNGFLENAPILSLISYQLDTGSVDTLTICSTSGFLASVERLLTETAANSLIFTDNFMTLRLPTASADDGSLRPFLDWSAFGLTNAKLRLTAATYGWSGATLGTSANLQPAMVPDVAAWHINIVSYPGTSQLQGTLKVRHRNDESEPWEETTIGSLELAPVGTGPNRPYRTTKPVVLLQPDGVENAMLSADRSNHQVMKWPADLPLDRNPNHQELVAFFSGGTLVPVGPAKGTAMIMRSFEASNDYLNDFMENDMGEMLQGLGFTTSLDISTLKSEFFTYIPFKEIILLHCHGATDTGSPTGVFKGVKLYDQPLSAASAAIAATPNLTPNLVFVNACSSAQTDNTSVADAKSNDSLSADAQIFAKAWNPKGKADYAYLGMAWEVNVPFSIATADIFMRQLNGVRTIQQAFDEYRSVQKKKGTGNGYLLLKVWAPNVGGKTPGMDQVIGK